MKKILLFVEYYVPGSKGGGPIRSVYNAVQQLKEDFQFYIMTSDRDLHDKEPYPNIVAGQWNDVDGAQVYYVSKEEKQHFAMKKIINTIDYDYLYLNSLFSYHFSIKILLMLKLKLIKDAKVILAPRGELSEEALGIKGSKKQLFLTSGKRLGLYKNIYWRATAEHEAAHIKTVFGEDCHVTVSPELAAPIVSSLNKKKKHDVVKVVFLSRISKMKNVTFLLKQLAKIKVALTVDIYGPIEDEAYWQECQELLKLIPPTIKVQHRGRVEHEQVRDILAQYDFFVRPTLGENYGHAIVEALSAGCPILISDRTPWRHLQKKNVGWDVSLEDEFGFREAIYEMVRMSDEEYTDMASNALEFAERISRDEQAIEQYRHVFQS